MRIPIKIGDGFVYLQSKDGQYELAEKLITKVKVDGVETGETIISYVAYKWITTLDAVIKTLLEMKIRASDASTLAELKSAIDQARRELSAEYCVE